MLRVTIRELLLLTAFFAVGLAALKCANDVLVRVSWNGIILCLLIAMVVAVADRGRRQAIASGFASCLAIYLVLLVSNSQLPNDRGYWVTENLLDSLHEAMVTTTWVDNQTGQEVAFDPRWRYLQRPTNIGRNQVPEKYHLKVVGHFLSALLLGYFGGRIAGWIYAQRAKAEKDYLAGGKRASGERQGEE